MEAQKVPVSATKSSKLVAAPSSRITKPFRHFHRDLDLNIKFLSAFLLEKNAELHDADKVRKLGVIDPGSPDNARFWQESGSIPTVAWRDYNVFQFHNPALYDLLRALGLLAREACQYYELDFDRHRYMAQGWFNVNYSNVGKLDWHAHSHVGAPHFHGYYCVSAEPSSTFYRVDGEELEVVNRNNRALLGESLHEHAMGDWTWDGPRITVAYDIVPLRELQPEYEQHFVPLP